MTVAAAGCANFHAVSEGAFYRSAQPTTERLAGWIERHGIRTVVYLRGSAPDSPNFRATHDAVTEMGIDFVQVPLTARRHPTRAELLALWEALETAEYPVLVHCHGGADRSGLASALHVLRGSGSTADALDQFAFAPYLHTGLRGAWQLPDVIARYRPWRHQMQFPDWVRMRYDPPSQP